MPWNPQAMRVSVQERDTHMSIEIAVGIVAITTGVMAVAAVIVVVKLVPLLDRLQKTMKEAEQLLHNLNEDGPILLREATEAVQNVNRIARDLGEVIGATKQDVESMSTLGRTIKRVYGLVQVGADVMRINGWLNGIRALLQRPKHRSPAYRSYYGKGLS